MRVIEQFLLCGCELTGQNRDGYGSQECGGCWKLHGITPEGRTTSPHSREPVAICGNAASLSAREGWTGGTPLSAKDNAWLNVIFRHFSPFFVNESLVESHYTGGDACDLTPAHDRLFD